MDGEWNDRPGPHAEIGRRHAQREIDLGGGDPMMNAFENELNAVAAGVATGQPSEFLTADLARDAGLLKMVPRAADTLLKEHPVQVEKLIRRWIGDASRFAGV